MRRSATLIRDSKSSTFLMYLHFYFTCYLLSEKVQKNLIQKNFFSPVATIISPCFSFWEQVVPLVDSLYRPFFPNITFCGVKGNKTLMESVRGRGYHIITYELPNTVNETIGNGWLSYRYSPIYLLSSNHPLESGGIWTPSPPPPPLIFVKTSQKRWPLHMAASFVSHWAPSDNFLNSLLHLFIPFSPLVR